MPLLDLPVEDLRRYRPEVAEPDDFDDFWSATLDQARSHPLDVVTRPVETGLRLVEVLDVSFAGFDGQRVSAWLTRPAAAREPLPVVVEYQGYGGGRGLAHERLTWATAGYAHLFMDTRGQGSTWGSGGAVTPDGGGSGAPAANGFVTRGILDPADHYYRRLFTDAVRAVEAARALPGVDGRVAVAGTSQGGGIALAVAGLVPDLAAVMPDVPFLCHFRRAAEIAPRDPYAEIVRYLSVHRDQVDVAFRTLSYLDGVNFARRASAPALFSVALMDPTCPPSTVYAAYNHYGSHHGVVGGTGGPEAEIVEYPFNEHEGGQGHQLARQIRWLAEQLPLR
ncbi:acetylxylan esterase [Actinotalea sp. K2]|uniref:acetylxylan esterase n=1 Tax=Actinotalea sp. K2 TaxID=2939438 RepID=UPI002016CCEB|nr:acetylxylan esterase [Actinotalea sp. K2]MCL3861317.1 acetylxylan esterase [Actinotalea sp. K2]